MDDFTKHMRKQAEELQNLAREAVRLYSSVVDDILKTQCHDVRQIEWCLDGMLGFCFDDVMLTFYKKLCRYYYEIDPRGAVSYVYAYRELWDEQAGLGDEVM